MLQIHENHHSSSTWAEHLAASCLPVVILAALGYYDNMESARKSFEKFLLGSGTPPKSGEDVMVKPLLYIPGVALLPNQTLTIRVGRQESRAAVRQAIETDGQIVVAIQRESDTARVTLKDIYPIACLGVVASFNTAVTETIIMVHGQGRVYVADVHEANEVPSATIKPILEPNFTTEETKAKIKVIQDLVAEYLQSGGTMSPNSAHHIFETTSISALADSILALVDPNEAKFEFFLEALQEVDPLVRLDKALQAISDRLEQTRLQNKIRHNVSDSVNKQQREVILREQLKAIRKELNELDHTDNESDSLKQKITDAGMPEPVLKRALKELDRLESTPSMSPEVGLIRNYLDWLIDLPWDNNVSETIDINAAARILDEDHYGLPKVKERILEWMAMRQRMLKKHPESDSSKIQTPILCFVGPPGVGKTSLGRSIARALDRKLVRISLGGLRDEAEIRGHRRTYIGALPGRIIQAMKQAGTRNAVIMLDEIDKVGQDFRGDPSAALLEVLDPEQNHEFSDHYLEVPYDLSKVLFITTANMLDTITPPLRDRMEIIRISGYTEEEKMEIAKRHLLPRQLERHALLDTEVQISDAALHTIIRNYTKEAGVRSLERQIAQILRKLPRQMAEDKSLTTIQIDNHNLIDYLGPMRFDTMEMEAEDKIGMATGVVVSEAGGDLVTVEAISINTGHSELQLTGQIGDVMRESARAAMSWVRAHGEEYGVPKFFFDNNSIHIHVPAGAIPKDGPSAGVTLTTALMSVASNRPIRHDVAMTGEVTLRGHVLPIGGVKDKLLAAKRAGIKVFLLPEGNRRDLYDISPDLLEGMEIKFVSTQSEVLDVALLPPQSPPVNHPMGFRGYLATNPEALMSPHSEY